MGKIRNNSKRLVAILLTLLMLAGCISGSLATASAAANAAPDYVTNSEGKALWAKSYNTDTIQNIEAVKWYAKDGKYYWFLPSSADLSNLTIYHNYGSVKIGSQSIVNGTSYSFLENGKEYDVTTDAGNYKLVVQKASGIGSMFITTASGSLDSVNADKNHKEKGNMVLVDYDGKISYDSTLKQIKGRGNSTWRLDKKPYNLSLDNTASLMGMGQSKKWSLLANAQEHSMIRNRFMYDLANEVGLLYAPESKFVDFYANGEYVGTYQLSEKVESGKNKLVGINDLEKQTEKLNDQDLDKYSQYSQNGRVAFNIPNNPADITGGYLIEYVMDTDEDCYFKTKRGQGVNLKGPEACSKEQINYIADFVQDMEDAIYSSTGKNSKGKHYTEYIDEESAALMYLLQELSVNVDAGISSCYFYKDADSQGDGKLHAGPSWDFDVSLGNLMQNKDGVNMTDYNKWFVNKSKRYSDMDTIWAALCKHSQFNTLAKKLWAEKVIPALDIALGNAQGTNRLDSLQNYGKEVASSSIMNYTRWDLSTNLLVPAAGKTHQAQFDYLVNWVQNRTSFMNSGLLDLDAAKKAAKELILSTADKYKTEGYSDEIVQKITEVAKQGTEAVDKATTHAQVANILQNTLDKMDGLAPNIVYFNNQEMQWENVYVYYYGGTDTPSWPGYKMSLRIGAEGSIYQYEIPKGHQTVIFTNGLKEKEGKEQTEDLTIMGNNYLFTPDMSSGITDPGKEAVIYSGSWTKMQTDPLEPKFGDINGDDVVDMKDVLLVQKEVAKYITFTDRQKTAADVNGDGKIDMNDVLYIQKHVAKLFDKFPVEA